MITALLGSFFSTAQANQRSLAVEGEYIVKYKKYTSMSGSLKVLKSLGTGLAIKNQFLGSRTVHIKINNESVKDLLYTDPTIEYIEPNYILSIDPIDVEGFGSAPQPSDTYSQSSAPTRVRDSWSIQKPYNQGSKAVVAIIDSGLDRNHLLFKDSGGIWVNNAEQNGLPGVDDDGNGYIDDINGWNFVGQTADVADDNNHGTHVAGIVIGIGQDVFVDPVRESKVQIMPLKFLDSNGSGTTANAVSAIHYAVDNGAKVINNSWGGSSYSVSLHDAYAYAYSRGVVIVSAAGNSNSNNDFFPIYPGNLDSPNNISVAASTNGDNRASFSNYGPTTVTLAAPGVSVLSSIPGANCLNPGCFQMMSGTSMAAPFVAGLAALVWREAPQLTAYQIKNVIVATVDPGAGLQNVVSTSGRVNVYRAIESAKLLINEAPSAPAYTPEYKTSRSVAVTGEGGSAGGGGGCGTVSTDKKSSSQSAASRILLAMLVLLLPLGYGFFLKRSLVNSVS